MADSGIQKPPPTRFATAILDSKVLVCLISSLRLLAVRITSTFKRMAAGEKMDAKTAKVQGKVVSCTSHIKPGACEQSNTGLVVFDKEDAVSSSFWSMVMTRYVLLSKLTPLNV